MEFDDILAICIERLAKGEPIESCLERFPDEAARLEPLLLMADLVRSQPKLMLSDAGFKRGRQAVAQAAATHKAFALVNGPSDSSIMLVEESARRASASARKRSRPVFAWPALAGTAIAACLLIVVLMAASQSPSVLPGSRLYEVKLLGEEGQGLLMAAVGDEAEWHGTLAERRLAELRALQSAGRPATANQVGRLLNEVQAATEASIDLPVEVQETVVADLVENLDEATRTLSVDSNTLAALQNARNALAGVDDPVQIAAVAATETPSVTAQAPTQGVPEQGAAATPKLDNAPAEASEDAGMELGSSGQAPLTADTVHQPKADQPPTATVIAVSDEMAASAAAAKASDIAPSNSSTPEGVSGEQEQVAPTSMAEEADAQSVAAEVTIAENGDESTDETLAAAASVATQQTQSDASSHEEPTAAAQETGRQSTEAAAAPTATWTPLPTYSPALVQNPPLSEPTTTAAGEQPESESAPGLMAVAEAPGEDAAMSAAEIDDAQSDDTASEQATAEAAVVTVEPVADTNDETPLETVVEQSSSEQSTAQQEEPLPQENVAASTPAALASEGEARTVTPQAVDQEPPDSQPVEETAAGESDTEPDDAMPDDTMPVDTPEPVQGEAEPVAGQDEQEATTGDAEQTIEDALPENTPIAEPVVEEPALDELQSAEEPEPPADETAEDGAAIVTVEVPELEAALTAPEQGQKPAAQLPTATATFTPTATAMATSAALPIEEETPTAQPRSQRRTGGQGEERITLPTATPTPTPTLTQAPPTEPPVEEKPTPTAQPVATAQPLPTQPTTPEPPATELPVEQPTEPEPAETLPAEAPPPATEMAPPSGGQEPPLLPTPTIAKDAPPLLPTPTPAP
ncbi:MAG: DUF5667 domain-containing protein [Caldilineaceae bacterium]